MLPNKNRNLRVYERDHLYPQCVPYYLDLFSLSPDNYPHIINYWEVLSFGDYFFWARDTYYLERYFRNKFSEWVNSKNKLNKTISHYKHDHKLIVNKLKKFKKRKLTGLSNSQLYKLRQQIIKLALRHLYYAEYQVDLFDDYIATLISEKVTLLAGKDVSQKDLSDFSHPATLSVVIDCQKNILELSLLKKIPNKKLMSLVSEFGWIRMSWDGNNELDVDDVEADILEVKKQTVRQRKIKLENINNFSNNVSLRRRQLLKKYKLRSDSLNSYFKLLDNFNLFHDFRKEIQMRSNQVIYKVMREIPNRFKVSYDDFLYYKNFEVEKLFKTGKLVSSQIIKKRKLGMLWLIQKGKINEVIGKKVESVAQKLVWSNLKSEGQIVGFPASKGVVQGIAFVTKNAREANKSFPRGHILITPMTTVDYLPAMKRAKAIITDDGGATCHAAIVSRELEIPCIVGTKIATRAIKTGDRIELDGKKGLIKKLSN